MKRCQMGMRRWMALPYRHAIGECSCLSGLVCSRQSADHSSAGVQPPPPPPKDPRITDHLPHKSPPHCLAK